MNSSKTKKMAIECLQNKWKKVVLFIFCYIVIEYILTRLLLPISKSSMIYNSLNNILSNIFKLNEDIATGVSRVINTFANITYNLTSNESVNYDIISLISYITKGEGILILILFSVKIIFEVPLAYALTISLMKLKRGGDIGIFSFLENDNFQFKRAFAVELRRIEKLIIPIILIVITYIMMAGDYIGILRSHRYMQNIFLYDKYSASMNKYTMKFIIDICLIIISTVYYYIQRLKYVMSFKIAYDEPNLSAKQVVEKSKTLMMGHRKEYFMLKLSFIGWEILAYLTLCIGYLWLIPYIQVSTICFYDNLKES